jgi:hypothetical protein
MKKATMFVAALAAVMVAAPAEAQMRTATFGVGGGPTLPIGDLGNVYDTGWHVQGSFALAPMTLPFGVRVDLNYTNFPHGDHSDSMLAGIVNGMFALPAAGLRPYLSAGVGAYNSKHDDQSETDIGVNGGAGLQFGMFGMNAYLEGRLHNLFTEGASSRFIPISVGIMF